MQHIYIRYMDISMYTFKSLDLLYNNGLRSIVFGLKFKMIMKRGETARLRHP